MTEPAPLRGEVWAVDLGTSIGHEAAFTRPALIVSADRFNVHGLVVLCPIGRAHRPYPTRVHVDVGLSGLGPQRSAPAGTTVTAQRMPGALAKRASAVRSGHARSSASAT